MVLLLFIFSTPNLCAEVFLFRDGGKIEGEHLNPQETPRKIHRIQAASGLEIAVEPKHVERIRKGEREAVAEYNSFAPFKENTVANHLEIAKWCREHQLFELSRRHLLQVVEYEPNNKEARHLLGHFKAPDGTWTTREEFMGAKGYLKHGGVWKTQQQIDIEQIIDTKKKSQLAWEKRINALRSTLPGNAKARSELTSINDPTAVLALLSALSDERNPETKILIIKTLSNIGNLTALIEIARWSMRPSELPEVRRTCFDELKKHPEAISAVIGFYTGCLRPENGPKMINAAAFALGELNGRSAIPHLIDVLHTTRSKKVKKQAAGPAFGAEGMAFGWGETEETIVEESNNTQVLNALIQLTGANFQFNQAAWRNWLVESRRTSSFNARRGLPSDVTY